jgi:hypothetical protein
MAAKEKKPLIHFDLIVDGDMAEVKPLVGIALEVLYVADKENYELTMQHILNSIKDIDNEIKSRNNKEDI